MWTSVDELGEGAAFTGDAERLITERQLQAAVRDWRAASNVKRDYVASARCKNQNCSMPWAVAGSEKKGGPTSRTKRVPSL